MSYREEAITFECAGHTLLGIVSRPDQVRSTIGVIIVVGGPQYRVGSHRQFVLLARRLAEHGHPVLRFDYRGMGDSDGAIQPFDAIDADIGAAVATLFATCPQLKTVCLWGLCDAASAALIYAPTDSRVLGLALLNPWVRSESTIARTYLRHYYLGRVLSPEFWKKFFSESYSPIASARSFVGNFLRAWKPAGASNGSTDELPPFQERMLRGLERFRGSVLLMLSGRDLTAQEFVSVTDGDRRWRRSLSSDRVKRWEIAEADHTFSSKAWRGAVERETIAWLDELRARSSP